MTFTPYAAVTAVVPCALALRLGSRAGALLAAGAGVALGAAVLGDRRRPRRTALPAGRRLRVATVSLRLGLVPAAAVLELVRANDVDVLSVQELTPEAKKGLRAAGLAELMPHAVVIPARAGSVPAASGAVWSRLPLRPAGAVPGSFEQPTVRIYGGGLDVELTAVHLMPPATSADLVHAWAADLAALPDPLTASSASSQATSTPRWTMPPSGGCWGTATGTPPARPAGPWSGPGHPCGRAFPGWPSTTC